MSKARLNRGEKFTVVERPVCECVKLFNTEDMSLFEDIAAVTDALANILGTNVAWYHRLS